jgi:hypothetical protein
MVTLQESKTCTKRKWDIDAGETAIRKPIPETKKAAARVEYYHQGCWEGK